MQISDGLALAYALILIGCLLIVAVANLLGLWSAFSRLLFEKRVKNLGQQGSDGRIGGQVIDGTWSDVSPTTREGINGIVDRRGIKRIGSGPSPSSSSRR